MGPERPGSIDRKRLGETDMMYLVTATRPDGRAGDGARIEARNKTEAVSRFHEMTEGIYSVTGDRWQIKAEREVQSNITRIRV